MVNIITRADTDEVMYLTNDDVTLPTKGEGMVEFHELPIGNLIRVPAQDISVTNAKIYKGRTVDKGIKAVKYKYDGSKTVLNDKWETEILSKIPPDKRAEFEW